jgi:membrane-associated phospholipid phosphatase
LPLLGYGAGAIAVARARRKIGLPRILSLAAAASVPVAVARAMPPGRVRSGATWATHMWAYKIAFEIPYDAPAKLRERLHIDYPIRADAALAGGAPPGEQLQRRLRQPPRLTWLDRAASLLYYTWEVEPHAAMLWILLRHPEDFPAAAARLGSTFDLTLLGYYTVPTAPPWWASEREGRMGRSVRRVVLEVAKELRGQARPGIDHNVGSNPWAAMPSDHFASSVMTALVLAEIDRGIGAAAGAYALALGSALVYTGEHYLTDLIAGLSLALGVFAAAPRVSRRVRAIGDLLAP